MPPKTIQKRPNVLLILADDLGYSDIGCFGSEIKTPHLDQMAKEGVLFTDYHTAAVCSPTRSMLLSGTDCHLAGLGVMSEFRTVDPERWNQPGHEGFLNYDIAALPEILSDNGYFCCMSGKWHLGYKDECGPHSRGFHRSFAMLPGCANHFGWEPRWEKEEGGVRPNKFVPGHSPPLYTEDGVKVQPATNFESSGEKGFYSSRSYTETLIDYISSRPADKPFFAFLPFGAPHYPLQCPKEDRDHYKGMYADGPDALRLRRLAALKKLGIIPQDVVPHPVHAVTAEWEDMSNEERQLSAKSMEIYAGMVEGMDRAVGTILDYLKQTGELDNTLVIFQSDNGAEGAAMEANPAMGPNLLQTIDKYYDNSMENLGNYNSFCWYGPRWAQASTAPGRLYKAYNTEGGIRVPLVVRYPPFTSPTSPHASGTLSSSFATCMDVMPTILELAGIRHPNASPAHPRAKADFRGRQVYGMRGKSWAPYLTKAIVADTTGEQLAAIHGSNDAPVGFEQFGRGALRKGRWKINHMNAKDYGTGAWELHDLVSDPGENIDLSKQMPDKLAELVQDFETYCKETGTVWGPPVDMGQARTPLPEDMIGGDPILDQRAWMAIGVGQRLRAKA